MLENIQENVEKEEGQCHQIYGGEDSQPVGPGISNFPRKNQWPESLDRGIPLKAGSAPFSIRAYKRSFDQKNQ